MGIRATIAIVQAASGGRPETRSMRGSWPVEPRTHQIVTRNLGGHGVDQRMKVERLVFHHRSIQHHGNAAGRVVDGGKRCYRAGLDAQQSRSRSEAPNENRPLAASTRCRLFSRCRVFRRHHQVDGVFLVAQKQVLGVPAGHLAAQSGRVVAVNTGGCFTVLCAMPRASSAVKSSSGVFGIGRTIRPPAR